MSEKADRLCKGLSLALACVNGGVLFVAFRQWHQVSIHSSANHEAVPLQSPAFIQALQSMPSLLLVLLLVTLLALLGSKEWLRPSWIPLGLNVLWLAGGCFLLQSQLALLL
jgi:hypothetical protein